MYITIKVSKLSFSSHSSVWLMAFCRDPPVPELLFLLGPFVILQLPYWNTRTMWWTFDSLIALHIRTGCQTSWTSSRGRCRSSARKVQLLYRTVASRLNVTTAEVFVCFQWRRCWLISWTSARTTSSVMKQNLALRQTVRQSHSPSSLQQQRSPLLRGSPCARSHEWMFAVMTRPLTVMPTFSRYRYEGVVVRHCAPASCL